MANHSYTGTLKDTAAIFSEAVQGSLVKEIKDRLKKYILENTEQIVEESAKQIAENIISNADHFKSAKELELIEVHLQFKEKPKEIIKEIDSINKTLVESQSREIVESQIKVINAELISLIDGAYDIVAEWYKPELYPHAEWKEKWLKKAEYYTCARHEPKLTNVTRPPRPKNRIAE